MFSVFLRCSLGGLGFFNEQCHNTMIRLFPLFQTCFIPFVVFIYEGFFLIIHGFIVATSIGLLLIYHESLLSLAQKEFITTS